MKTMKLGVSLFSYTHQYTTGQYTLEDCIRNAADIGAECFEMVGAQMLPTYPYITDEYAKVFKDMCERHGIYMTSYGANMDRGKLPDRDLSEEEMFMACINDLKTAGKLGATMMRIQYMTPPGVMKKLEPYAEAYGVHCGIEIHNPETPSSPKMLEYLDAYKQINSKHLGFVVDFGCFANKPNKPHWDQALAGGATEDELNFAAQCVYDKIPLDEARAAMINRNASPAAMVAFASMYGFVTFYREPDFKGLAELVPYISYCHGKFHHISEDLEEASIPYYDVLKTLADAGYDGTIVTENEGRHGDLTLEMTRRHLAMERKILESL